MVASAAPIVASATAQGQQVLATADRQEDPLQNVHFQQSASRPLGSSAQEGGATSASLAPIHRDLSNQDSGSEEALDMVGTATTASQLRGDDPTHTIALQMQRSRQVLQTMVADPDSCLLYTSPSPRDRTRSRMPSSA